MIERIPITVQCDRCEKPYAVGKKSLDFACPDCGQKGTTLLSGRNFMVKSIEIQ